MIHHITKSKTENYQIRGEGNLSLQCSPTPTISPNSKTIPKETLKKKSTETLTNQTKTEFSLEINHLTAHHRH